MEEVVNFLVLQTNCDDNHLVELKKTMSHFKSDFKYKWAKSNRTKSVFERNELKWLEETITFKKYSEIHSTRPGRPQKGFNCLSDRRKRERVTSLRKSSTSELVFAAQMNARASGDHETAAILKKSLSPPRDSTTIPSPRLTATEALSLLMEAQLSRHQYNVIRRYAIDIFPSYKAVQNEKKKCYPEDIRVTEQTAEVPIQNLLNHTAERIVDSQKDVIGAAKSNQLTLFSKIGFDGSSGHSEYHQRFLNETDADDKFVFMTCLVPLELTDGKLILWKNQCPSSPRYCRTSKIIFEKETDYMINRENESVTTQVAALEATVVVVASRHFFIKHEVVLSMIDGKICNSLSGTRSALRCYLCQATSKDFNDIDKMVDLPISRQYLHLGVSVLHAWIRFFEFLLHVAYKIPTQEWRKSKEMEEILKQNKLRIQAAFRAEFGIKIDKPKPGYGNTNTGNIARRFFQNSVKVSQITGLDETLIKKFHIILQCLSSGFKLNEQKFKIFCLETAKLYVSLYPWYYMSTTVHKILIHGHEIVSHSPLPIGQLSEEALEARNKDFKIYREHFSRKTSRLDTMSDIFNRMLISSDPVITSQRATKKTKGYPFDSEAIKIFSHPDCPISEINSEYPISDDSE